MKILHLLTSFRYSGAENVVCQIVDMFRDDDTVEMVYCSPDGPIRETLDEKNVRFAPLSRLDVQEVKRVIRELRPDVIHAHDMRASFVAALACGRRRLVSHIHNNNFDSRSVSVKSLLYFYAALKAKHLIWVSDAAFEGYRFHKMFRKKSEVLYNIIDAEQLRDRAEQAPCKDAYDVVYLGRLSYPKHPQRLVEVLEKVHREIPGMTAAMIGNGDLEEDVRTLLAEKGLEHTVKLLGFMSNPYGILSRAKVMVMTSRWEGLPMCALEAMALGIPIVSTPTDGLKYAVVQNETGFLSENDEELAGSVAAVLTDDALRQRLSENTLRRSRKIMDEQAYKRTLLTCYTGR